ncbi:hypothetical protein [Nocardioides perillae]|uniref:Uncharacterized protein n=1 Tax=Nocardioides perillae TaxID=1119534 RepID=A0A7Y9RWG1_9ACTN|nr:hypothetical protein [Nocardioides perillae]NYG55235.1 hypothetical protein [Nocardioides perillae]
MSPEDHQPPTTEETKARLREVLDHEEPREHPDDSPEVGDDVRDSQVLDEVSQNGVDRRVGRAGGQPT